MSDVSFLLEIVAKLRDEASPGLARLKAELNSLKGTQEASNAEKDLGRAVEDRGRKEDEAKRKTEAHSRATSAGAKASQDSEEAVKRVGEAHEKTSKSTSINSREQDKFSEKLGKTGDKARETASGIDDLNERMENLKKRHDEINNSTPTTVDGLNKQREAYSDLDRQIKSVSNSYSRLASTRKETEQQLRTDAIKKSEQGFAEAAQARAQSERLQKLVPASRQPTSVDTAERVRQIKIDEDAANAKKDLEVRVAKLSIAYDNFDKRVKSGSLSEGETKRGYNDFSKELNNISRSFASGSNEAEKWGVKADEAGKKARNAAYESTGGLSNTLKNKDVGGTLDALNNKIGDIGIRITGVASFFTGFFELVKIGFSQQIITGVVALAGSLVSVAAAAAQAGAALAGAFVSGLGQAVPMLAIVGAAVERFKTILQAVSVAGQAEQQQFYDPTQKQVLQLQQASQLISANQQLSNSHIQLFEAQQRVRDSQIALTEARYTALRQITELSLAEKNARLQAEGATISLTESKRQLQIAIQRGDVAGLQQAELGVREAELNKKKADFEIPKSEREARLARQRGVGGAPSVISAVRGLEGSRLAVIQSQQGAESAQRQKQITDLQRQARSSRETSSESQLKFLKKGMSPTELGLTDALIAIEKELKSPSSPLKKITDYFVEPFTKAVERIRSLLKNNSFLVPIGELAKSMGAGLGRLEKLTFGKEGTSIFEQMAKDASENIPIISQSIEEIMKLFGDIAKAAAPAFHKLSEDWDKFWGKLNIKYGTPEGLKSLEKFFNKSVEYAEAFGRLGTALGGLFKAIGHDAAPQGKGIVEGLTGSIKEATSWVQSNGPKVTNFFREAKEGLSLIAGMLLGIGVAMLKVFSLTSLAALKNFLTEVLLPSLSDVVTVLGKATTAVLEFFNMFGSAGRKVLEIIGTSGVIVVGIVKIIGVIKDLKKAWEAWILFVEGTSWLEILANPIVAALAIVGLAIAAVMGAFSSGQKKNKISTEEVTQAIENQASAMRTLKDLSAEYKSSELGVKESRLAERSAQQSLVHTRKEKVVPGEGESAAEADEAHKLRVEQATEGVARSKLQREETERKFRELPSEQKEVAEKARTTTVKSTVVEKAAQEQKIASLESSIREHRGFAKEATAGETLSGKPSSSAEQKAEARGIAYEENQLAKARENLSTITEKGAKNIKAANSEISKSNKEMAGNAPRINIAYEEAFAKFGSAVDKGGSAAKVGMAKIRDYVDKSLKKYGITPAEIASAMPSASSEHKMVGEASKAILGHATGGYIPATPGGKIARVGEGGHDEVVLSTDPAHAQRSRQLLGQYFSRAPHMASGGSIPYQFPFSSGTFAGVDEGVDWSAKGPIAAIGKGTVVRAAPQNSGTGWPGEGDGGHGNRGAMIVYQLTEGPDRGKYIYLAENVDPVVHTGQEIEKGQEIANARGKFPFLETGFSLDAHGTPSGHSEYVGHQPTKFGQEFYSLIQGLQHGKIVTSGIASGVASSAKTFKEIIAPKIIGGGAIGKVAQGAVNIATIAANKHLEKLIGKSTSESSASMSSSGPGGVVAKTPSGGYSKNSWANNLLWSLGLPRSRQNINSIVGWENAEGGNWNNSARFNPLNTTQSEPGAGNTGSQGNIKAYVSWKQGLEATVTTLRNGLYNGILNALKQDSPRSFVSAVGRSPWGTSGSLLESTVKSAVGNSYAAGGTIAPWGGRPIPIIAHEGERIMNPAQYGETARLAGTSPGGLDKHLGYDGSPRQSFAAGGRIWIKGPHNNINQAMTEPELVKAKEEDKKSANVNVTASLRKKIVDEVKKEFIKFISLDKKLGIQMPGEVTSSLSQIKSGSLKSIIVAFKKISDGFKKLRKIGGKPYDIELGKYINAIIIESNGVLARLQKGREYFKASLERKAVGKEYTQKGGKVQIGSGGQTKIAEFTEKNLSEESRYLQNERNIIDKTIAETKKLKKSNSRTTALKTLMAKQKELGETIDQNIEARYQAETQTIQARITDADNIYQVTSQTQTAEISKAQAFGNLDRVSGIETQIREGAINQISVLEGSLKHAEAIGNQELTSSIKQSIIGLRQTVTNSVVETINNAQTLIQRESAQAESKSGSRLGLAKVLSQEGSYEAAGREEKSGLTEKQANLLSVRVQEEQLKEQALREGDIAIAITLGEELNKNSVEISENSLALKENAVVTRELIVNQIEATGQFRSGVYSAAQQGIETLGKITGSTNVTGLLSAAKGRESVYGEERTELGKQASGIGLGVEGMTPAQILSYLASPVGQMNLKHLESAEDKQEQEQMHKLVQALETNSVNTLKNAEEIAKLNGQLNQPQSFSTAAFTSFRDSFFTGMGNLLPTYSAALPPGSRPEGLPVYGSGTPGKPVGGTHIGQISLTHPVEKLDPALFGEELSYHISTTPPTS